MKNAQQPSAVASNPAALTLFLKLPIILSLSS